MSFSHLTDEQLRDEVAHDGFFRAETRFAARELLRRRVRAQLVRALANPAGYCAAGRPIMLDNAGAYSSGEVFHTDAYGACRDGGYRWTETPRRTAIRRQLDATALSV